MNPIDRRSLIGPTVSLFASTSTLLCCALPALLITIGAGAVAGLTAAVPVCRCPQIKGLFSSRRGAAKRICRWWRARNAPCPADPEQAAACNTQSSEPPYTDWLLSGICHRCILRLSMACDFPVNANRDPLKADLITPPHLRQVPSTRVLRVPGC